MFKVVMTLESDDNKVFCAVPAAWEENNKVYWPPNEKDIVKLRCNAKSAPDKSTWISEDCVLKMDLIETFQKAHEFEKAFYSCENTDAEEQ